MTTIEIFTDASYNPTKGVAGFAYIIRIGSIVIKKSGKINGDPKTSTNAEMICVANSIYHLISLDDFLPYAKILNICTDCLHGIKKFNRRQRYKYIDAASIAIGKLREKVKPNTIKVTFVHVKAHTSNTDIFSEMNRWCDTFAKKEMRKKAIEIEPNKVLKS